MLKLNSKTGCWKWHQYLLWSSTRSSDPDRAQHWNTSTKDWWQSIPFSWRKNRWKQKNGSGKSKLFVKSVKTLSCTFDITSRLITSKTICERNYFCSAVNPTKDIHERIFLGICIWATIYFLPYRIIFLNNFSSKYYIPCQSSNLGT